MLKVFSFLMMMSIFSLASKAAEADTPKGCVVSVGAKMPEFTTSFKELAFMEKEIWQQRFNKKNKSGNWQPLSLNALQKISVNRHVQVYSNQQIAYLTCLLNRDVFDGMQAKLDIVLKE